MGQVYIPRSAAQWLIEMLESEYPECEYDAWGADYPEMGESIRLIKLTLADQGITSTRFN